MTENTPNISSTGVDSTKMTDNKPNMEKLQENIFLDKTVSTSWDVQTWKMTEYTPNIENIVHKLNTWYNIPGLKSTKLTKNC